MLGSLNNALLFLVDILFSLYLSVLCIRLILAYSRANYFNPIVSFIIKITQPVIALLRRIMPSVGGIEFATLFFIILLELLKLFLLNLIQGYTINVVGLLIGALIATVLLILTTFFYAILIYAILSWVQPGPTPLNQVLNQLSAPILRPFRRIIPLIGGFDLSPLFALIFLQLLIILL